MTPDIYIARILLKDNKGFVQILEEGVFSTEDDAYAFLNSEFFGREIFLACMGEIISFVGGEVDKRIRYDSEKQLVEDKNPVIPMIVPDFVPKYQVGDIVRLLNNYPYIYGVVSAQPPEYESVPEALCDHQEALYIVEYISERGTLCHLHPEEASLEAADTVSEGHEFIYLLSRHYKGTETISDNIFKAIVEGSIYLLPNRTLNDVGIYLDNKVKHETWRYACGMFSEKQIAVFDAKAGLLLCDTENGRREYLGRFPNITGFSELRLYCCDPYICVVENRGINGAVVNTLTGEAIELVRGNYHVEHCCYPIGFVRRNGDWIL